MGNGEDCCFLNRDLRDRRMFSPRVHVRMLRHSQIRSENILFVDPLQPVFTVVIEFLL